MTIISIFWKKHQFNVYVLEIFTEQEINYRIAETKSKNIKAPVFESTFSYLED